MVNARLNDANPDAVADAALSAWARGDVDGILALCAPDVVFTIHVDDQPVDFGGTVAGRDGVGTTLRDFLSIFAFETFEVEKRVVEGDVVRSLVTFRCRHKAKGHLLAGRYRQEIEVEAGQIARIASYHDATMLRAFLILAAATTPPEDPS